jgi:hypothetical protein
MTDLQRENAALKRAVRNVLNSYAADTGDPTHYHGRLGYWSDSDSRCDSCAAWNRLRALVAPKRRKKATRG